MSQLLVVIDPLRGFAAADGSLGRHYGAAQLVRIGHVVERLEIALRWRPRDLRTLLVGSHFRPGQHTTGDLDHGLAWLCVPGVNQDCALAGSLREEWFDTAVWKETHDATTCAAFRTAVSDAIDGGVTRILLSGFLIEHCVRATALGLADMLPRRIGVAVCLDLVASRADKYVAVPDGPSEVERALADMAEAGVALDYWTPPVKADG